MPKAPANPPKEHEVLRWIGLAREMFGETKPVASFTLQAFGAWLASKKVGSNYVMTYDELSEKVDLLMETAMRVPSGWGVYSKPAWWHALELQGKTTYNNGMQGRTNFLNDMMGYRTKGDLQGTIKINTYLFDSHREDLEEGVSTMHNLAHSLSVSLVRWRGWEVYRADTVKEEDFERMMRRMSTAHDALIASGFRHLLYGRLIAVDRLGDFRWVGRGSNRRKVYSTGAHYVIDADEVHVSRAVSSGSPGYGVSVIVHELFHRHWYRGLTESQRKAYAEEVTDASGAVISSPSKYGFTDVGESFAEWGSAFVTGYANDGMATREIQAGIRLNRMTRSLFYELCGMPPSKVDDSFVPDVAANRVAEEYRSRADDQILVYTVSLLKHPAHSDVLDQILNLDKNGDSPEGVIRLLGQTEIFFRFNEHNAPLILADQVIGSLASFANRKLKMPIGEALFWAFYDITQNPNDWPDPDPLLLMNREELNQHYNDVEDQDGRDGGLDFKALRQGLTQNHRGTIGGYEIRIDQNAENPGWFSFAVKPSGGNIVHYNVREPANNIVNRVMQEVSRILRGELGLEASVPSPDSKLPQVTMAPVGLSVQAMQLSSVPLAGLLVDVAKWPDANGKFINQGGHVFVMPTRHKVVMIEQPSNRKSEFYANKSGPARWGYGVPFSIPEGALVVRTTQDGTVLYRASRLIDLDSVADIKLLLNKIGLIFDRAGVGYAAHR